MRTLVALALLVPATAFAIPMQLTHQGRLFNATGSALDGSHDLTLTLYDAPSSGTTLWSETQTLTFDNGFYTVMLGADSSNALDAATFDGDAVYLGLSIDSGPELPGRPQLVSVPYAYRALDAETAVNVSGGVVDATEIRINGTTVIADGDASLTNLGCSDGDTIVYAGGTATCVPEVAPRTDDEIRTVIAGEGYGLDSDIQAVAGSVAALTTLGGLSCSADGQVPRWEDSSSTWVCADAAVVVGTGLTGDGTASAPLAPDWNDISYTAAGGLVLEGEGPLAANVSIGSNASDSTATGGMVRLGASGDTGSGTRLYGLHTSDFGRNFSYGPARVVVRAKVSDNTGTGALGALGCSQNRGAWVAAGTGAALTPSSFAASDTWQDFEIWCNWQYDDDQQFVGWDGFDGTATADLSIDHVRIYPAASAGPKIWRWYPSSSITVDATQEDVPGLEAVTFDLDAPSRVKITYTGMIIRDSNWDGQHCSTWMYLDGSTSPISNRGGYGTGFAMLSRDASDNWWIHKDFTEVVDMAPGRHTLRVAVNENWSGSTESCIFSPSYGSQLVVEAFPLH